MTQKEIVTALRCCASSEADCKGNCAFFGTSSPNEDCSQKKNTAAADLIEAQKTKIDQLMADLMASVAGKELEQDEVKRSAAMREKVLRIIESRPEPIHAHIIVDWLGSCRCSHCGYDEVSCVEPYCEHCGAHFDEPEEKED